MREDAQRVIRIADALSRTVEQLAPRGRRRSTPRCSASSCRSRGAGGTLHVGHPPARVWSTRPAGSIRSSPSTCRSPSVGARSSRRCCASKTACWCRSRRALGGRPHRAALPLLRCASSVLFHDGVALDARAREGALRAAAGSQGGLARRRRCSKTSRAPPRGARARRKSVTRHRGARRRTPSRSASTSRARFSCGMLALPSTGIHARGDGGRARRHRALPLSRPTLDRRRICSSATRPTTCPGCRCSRASSCSCSQPRRAALRRSRRDRGAASSRTCTPSTSEARRALGRARWSPVNTPSTWFLGFNVADAPFDDVRVRRAIRAGLDVRGLVEQFHPGARVARSLTPPALLEVDRVHEPRTDVALARRLLAEAGHSGCGCTLVLPARSRHARRRRAAVQAADRSGAARARARRAEGLLGARARRPPRGRTAATGSPTSPTRTTSSTCC